MVSGAIYLRYIILVLILNATNLCLLENAPQKEEKLLRDEVLACSA